mmetsp:Transcript_15919/g.38755  ORF Transcript_15919/g.38755 Transcript_15919/m.38755 type:complete len:297 (+) Transcript_15919:64-954(+)
MMATEAVPESLVNPDALKEVFGIIDANGDGVLTVHEFILALRKNPEVGRLLDLGTTVGQEDDSRDLFEKVFQKLDEDSSKTVSLNEFQEYFRPDHGRDGGQQQQRQVDGGDGGDGAREASVSSQVLTEQLMPQQSPVVELDEDDIPGGCCGGGGKRLKPKPQPLKGVHATTTKTTMTMRDPPPPANVLQPSLVKQQPAPEQAFDPATTALDVYAAAGVPRAKVSPDELQEELLFLRAQLKSKGDGLRTKDVRVEELARENKRLRSEYNLQSLKQDMLVHMWSMHMLDADLQEGEDV